MTRYKKRYRKKDNNRANPIVAKVGGLQSQGAKGEAVVSLLRIPPWRDNAGSGVLRLSRRVNNMAKIDTNL